MHQGGRSQLRLVAAYTILALFVTGFFAALLTGRSIDPGIQALMAMVAVWLFGTGIKGGNGDH